MKLRLATMRSKVPSSNGSPLSLWAVKPRRKGLWSIQYSLNWLASSTASHSTRLRPEAPPSSMSVNMCCMAWPNSWNRVRTSSKDISATAPSAGGRAFMTNSATGREELCPSPASRRLRSTTVFIQAPPRFSPGRA